MALAQTRSSAFRILATAIVLVLFESVVVAAAETWKLTTEQRLDAWREFSNHADSSQGSSKGGSKHSLTASGREHPELIFRWQLFDYLVRGAFVSPPDYRDNFRHAIEARAAALGLGTDTWEKLRTASAPFIENRKKAMLLIQTVPADDSSAVQEDFLRHSAQDCTLRIEAMRASAAAIGDETLDRLLYVAVAPNFSTTIQYSEDEIQTLAWVEGGCE